MIMPYENLRPEISPDAFIANNATITGDVKIGRDSSIFFGTVIRGDVAPTIIGSGVNIQDLCMLHQSPERPLVIEDGVSVGHQATLHSAILRRNCLIGMGAMILDGAEIGEGAFIGAGSLVTPGKTIPPNVLAFGRPAKVIRELNQDDIDEMNRIRREYVERGKIYAREQSL